ncbi:hypothetical protein [Wolbachia endosymbiont of Pentidionis agamae]
MMGLRMDFMRALMLYYGHDAIVASEKVDSKEILHDASVYIS